MKPGTMFRDIATSLLQRPITERYPRARRATPPRLRGRLLWDPEGCTGCGLCATDCPAHALEVLVLDKKTKRFRITYHVDRCTFCAQCVHSCRQGCLQLSKDEWELAALARDAFVLRFGDGLDAEEGTDNDAAVDA